MIAAWRKGEREKGRKGQPPSPLLPFSPSPLLYFALALFAGAVAALQYWVLKATPVE